jgi:putative membrane protein
LSKLSGGAFDRAYARDMVQDHIHDVAAFKQEANYGKDPAIKAFASATLPTLTDHLKMARDMKLAVTGTAKAPASGQ